MADSRFFKETPCEHGNLDCLEVVTAPFKLSINDEPFIEHPAMPKRCPGGSRVELHPTQPDYEAGWLAYAVTSRGFRVAAENCVDAAVEGLLLLAEETE